MIDDDRIPGKRLFDLLTAAVLLVLTSPIMAIAAVLVRATSPGPALHRAIRVGRGGRTFTMYKFRSMSVEAERHGGSLTTGLNDPRVTPVGHRLRKYKLDELPQLLNVIQGDMSLVGPRPEVQECVDLYSPRLQEILTVRPGLTDLASLKYVDLAGAIGEAENPHQVYLDTVFDQKNELRLEYVTNRSWQLDLKILVRTALSVVSRRSWST